ncbi:periphilin-1 isoform X3 [Echinops telfairi]|uniref:Periphilin-1 isoform X3 n=1 Tax=Echinops telfairi TaxID=9371 RepID=A0AC55CUM8_ECHTE|nr:periphilin-1 isoform X3 [Echinops telfairi]
MNFESTESLPILQGTAGTNSLGKLVASQTTMLHIPVIHGYRPRLASRRDEMWSGSDGRYDYERLPRERAAPRSHPSDGYHRVVNIVPKKPPLLETPGEGSYNRYYSHVDYQAYDEGRSFSHDRRSGPSHRGDDSGYRWPRDDHSGSRQPDYRDVRDGFRRKSFYSSHYTRERSPHKKDNPFFRESPVGRKDSPHSRSGSSVSSRSYSPERSKSYSFQQSQRISKERPVQPLKTSRDTSPSSSAVSSSKVLDKPGRLTEKELAEAASKWAAEKREKADESNLPEIAEYETGPPAPLFIDQPEEPESNAADGIELFEDSQLTSRSKAIASKTKEIEQPATYTQLYSYTCNHKTTRKNVLSIILVSSSVACFILCSIRDSVRVCLIAERMELEGTFQTSASHAA